MLALVCLEWVECLICQEQVLVAMVQPTLYLSKEVVQVQAHLPLCLPLWANREALVVAVTTLLLAFLLV